jgi:hypothetical protein
MKKMKTASKNVKKNQKRKSLMGEWGKIGAPPKATKFPASPFTMERLMEMNSKGANRQCSLTLRKKISEGLEAGTIVALMPRKQPKGAVGRPKSVFVLKGNFDPSRMVLAPKSGETSVAVATVAPEVALPDTSAPVTETVSAVPLTPAPMVSATVTVETSAPAPSTPSQPVVG